MPRPRLRTPYRQRILAYCEKNGVVVPRNFDISKSSDRLAVIDITGQPLRLVPRTTFLEKEVLQFLARPENAGKRFAILDFRRCCELEYHPSGKLVRGSTFPCKAEGELLNLAVP